MAHVRSLSLKHVAHRVAAQRQRAQLVAPPGDHQRNDVRVDDARIAADEAGELARRAALVVARRDVDAVAYQRAQEVVGQRLLHRLEEDRLSVSVPQTHVRLAQDSVDDSSAARPRDAANQLRETGGRPSTMTGMNNTLLIILAVIVVVGYIT